MSVHEVPPLPDDYDSPFQFAFKASLREVCIFFLIRPRAHTSTEHIISISVIPSGLSPNMCGGLEPRAS